MAPDEVPAAFEAEIMFPVVVIVMIVDTEVVPSLMVIEYCPAAAGVVAPSETKVTTPAASVEILPVIAE